VETSHTAIIAQGFAIPAVVGLKNISSLVKTGETIIIDGDKGEVVLNPLPKICCTIKINTSCNCQEWQN
jgi:phosphotransferase system enzyme I (PtsI)